MEANEARELANSKHDESTVLMDALEQIKQYADAGDYCVRFEDIDLTLAYYLRIKLDELGYDTSITQNHMGMNLNVWWANIDFEKA